MKLSWTPIDEVKGIVPSSKVVTRWRLTTEQTVIYFVSEHEYNNLWHENMATEAVTDILVDYLYNVLDEDLYHVSIRM